MGEYLTDLETERSMKDQFMAHHAESPFVSARLHDFSGLQYFPPDERFRVRARLVRSERPQEAYLRTNRDGQAVMRYLGDLAFEIEGERLRLRVYHAGEGVGTSVFVPFRDRTSGRETYAAGRYLTLELSEDDDYELDFNRAFNPYCAYTESYECPFPPVENDLPVAIRAGEKSWAPASRPPTPPARKGRAAPKRRPGPRTRATRAQKRRPRRTG
ncbi:MAG TPA: DUF1684 domain-containing protein [Thermoplasmata archaeon]|nr:DUF1684 domain-containing protein [Thermoplasmata archaeon]